MTGTGDGLNFDFLNEPEPVPPPAPPPAPAVPSPLELPEGLELGGLEEPSSSIFDDGPEGPVDSLDQIPDAVPNISDGGTEILAHGRAELQEFEERFEPAEPAPSPPEVSPAEEAFAAPVEPPAVPEVPVSDSTESLLDGLFDGVAPTEESTPPTVTGLDGPGADTAVGLSPLGDPSPEVPSDFAPVSSGLSGLSLDLGTADTSLPSPAVEPESPLGEIGDPLTLGAAAAAVATSLDDLNTTQSSTHSKRPVAAAPGSNRVILIALAGYAAMITLLCLFLLVMLAKARRASQLESLPEIQPLSRERVALYPVNLELPAGHVLKLGEARRFGNLRVEPVKVTRGPAKLVHYSGDPDRGSYNTSPVLKLWFKFTNESTDQSFAPIDHDLVFLRNDSGVRANNNFLVEQSRKAAGGPLALMFDHNDTSHDFAGQNLGRPLKPGESIEAFVPTTEDEFEQLTGDLVWRVQLRKGLGPGGHGVTTLVEVAFASNEIGADGT